MAAIVPVVRRILAVVTGILQGTHEFYFASSTFSFGEGRYVHAQVSKKKKDAEAWGMDHPTFRSAKINARGESKLSKGFTFGSS